MCFCPLLGPPPSHHGSVVRQIENFPTSQGDAPTEPIVIADCGALDPSDPSLSADATTGGDPYEDFPDDEERVDVHGNPELALEAAKKIRELGNALFKEGKTEAAYEKYQSTSIAFLNLIHVYP
jgi:peptidyl-prolyl isomerase D